MRVQFSQKVDKYILSPALTQLVEEAKEYLLTLKDHDKFECLNNLSEMDVPNFIDLNRAGYIVSDSIKYHINENAELSLLKFTPNLTDEQVTEYKNFLTAYYHNRNGKLKWMICNQLLKITSIGPIAVYGVTSWNPQNFPFRTLGYKLYRLVDGLNSYYLNDKMCDLIELEPLLDESKPDGNAVVKPITLDQLVKEIGDANYNFIEGVYYQETCDSEAVCLEIEPWVDGVDTPYIVQAIIDLIRSNTVIGGNFNGKARENIELALSKANEYMQSLPLNTKLTEIELLGINIKKLLDIHDSIPLNGIGDRTSNANVDMFKDVNPDELCEDIINFSKLAAKQFKHVYDTNSAKEHEYFLAEDIIKDGSIKCKSGVNPHIFSTMYYNINKLGLASYVAD